MTVHREPCRSIGAHIHRERHTASALMLPVSQFIRLAVVEYDREHGVEPIDPVDAYKRMRELGWTEPELRWAAGDR